MGAWPVLALWDPRLCGPGPLDPYSLGKPRGLDAREAVGSPQTPSLLQCPHLTPHLGQGAPGEGATGGQPGTPPKKTQVQEGPRPCEGCPRTPPQTPHGLPGGTPGACQGWPRTNPLSPRGWCWTPLCKLPLSVPDHPTPPKGWPGTPSPAHPRAGVAVRCRSEHYGRSTAPRDFWRRRSWAQYGGRGAGAPIGAARGGGGEARRGRFHRVGGRGGAMRRG